MTYFIFGAVCFGSGFGAAWFYKGRLTAKLAVELAALKASATNAVNKL